MKNTTLTKLGVAMFCVGLVWFLVGNHANPFTAIKKSQEAKAIVPVWKQLHKANVAAESHDANGTENINWLTYANGLSDIDCTACPRDFQDQFLSYIQQVKELGKASEIGKLPSAEEKNQAMARYAADMTNVQSGLLELKRIATLHGVAFSDVK